MKIICTIFAFAMIIALTSVSNGQTEWEKYPSNPVLVADEPWCVFLGPVSVFFDDTTYHLWYSGHDGGTHARIGYAVSPDGIVWTPYAANPVLDVGPENTWDDTWVGNPCVLFDGNTYHMWYQGWNGTNHRIGYATSPDKITWTKYAQNPVMRMGSEVSWDDRGVGKSCIYFDGNIFHIWYGGWNSQNLNRIGYATSPDGITWTKYAGNPVLDVGVSGEWDSLSVFAPNVIFDGTIYHMWYSGGTANWESSIGYATSADGITWTKYAGNPVLDVGLSGEWDNKWVGYSEVFFDKANSLYTMWYGGGTQDWIGSMGYATAPDTILDNIYDGLLAEVPNNFVLMQNYPNPFNPSTTIEFNLPKSEFVVLKVYNILGKEVSTIVSKKLNQGNHTYKFDGRNLASGIYYYQLVAGDYNEVKKMILLK